MHRPLAIVLLGLMSLHEALASLRGRRWASTAMLLKVLKAEKINPKLLITHRFKLGAILEAYDTFANAAKAKALKVIIEA